MKKRTKRIVTGVILGGALILGIISLNNVKNNETARGTQYAPMMARGTQY